MQQQAGGVSWCAPLTQSYVSHRGERPRQELTCTRTDCHKQGIKHAGLRTAALPTCCASYSLRCASRSSRSRSASRAAACKVGGAASVACSFHLNLQRQQSHLQEMPESAARLPWCSRKTHLLVALLLLLDACRLSARLGSRLLHPVPVSRQTQTALATAEDCARLCVQRAAHAASAARTRVIRRVQGPRHTCERPQLPHALPPWPASAHVPPTSPC